MGIFLANFWPNFWATLAGGICLSFLYFIFQDKFFRLPNLNGAWYFETTTFESSFNPYKGMKLQYRVLIFQEGNRISGSGEKIYEMSAAGAREYVGSNRTRIEIEGYINKFYINPDCINIHYYEDGLQRKSSTFQRLSYEKFGKSETFLGTFDSTIAEQSGTVVWTRQVPLRTTAI